MKKTVLKNGLRVIYKEQDTDIVTVNVSVLVGSINETPNIRGISHFLEHMVFEGTLNYSCEELAKEIEQYGGEFNAYTSDDKTNFYVKIHKKHAKKAIEILSDMVINPLFDVKSIKKEKNVVLEEINMVNDEPRNYQWVFFEEMLFSGPFAYPTYGTKKTVSKLTKKDLEAYHGRYYVSNNIIVTIVGDCKNHLKLVTPVYQDTYPSLKHLKYIFH